MPLSRDKMRDYQRSRRATKPAGRPRMDTAKAAALATGRARAWDGKPYRNQNGELVIQPGRPDPGHLEHYFRRRMGEDRAECVDFDYQGRKTVGCGEIRGYEGKLLNINVDGSPDLGMAIIESDQFKRVQAAMPVTKGRAPG